jgi:hypothetical protein
MHKPQFGTEFYGLGTGITQTDDEKFLNHSGGVPGFSSYFKVGTDSKTGVYIASNATRASSIDCNKQFFLEIIKWRKAS